PTMLPNRMSSEITSSRRPFGAASPDQSSVAAGAAAAALTNGHERVVRFLRRPGNALQQHRLDLRIGEVAVIVSLHPDERAVRLRPARECALVGPDLRHFFTRV